MTFFHPCQNINFQLILRNFKNDLFTENLRANASACTHDVIPILDLRKLLKT